MAWPAPRRPVRPAPRPGAFLAVRRVFAAQGAARLVVVTTALSLGLVVYAERPGRLDQPHDRGQGHRRHRQRRVVTLPRVRELRRRAARGRDGRRHRAGSTILPGDVAANVLVVQPEQVAGVVRWNDALADQPLEELMAALARLRRRPGARDPRRAFAGERARRRRRRADHRLRLLHDAGRGRRPRRRLPRPDQPRAAAGGRLGPLRRRDRGRQPRSRAGARAARSGPAASSAPSSTPSPPPGTPRPTEDVTSAAEFATRPELHAQGWSLDYLRAIALAAGSRPGRHDRCRRSPSSAAGPWQRCWPGGWACAGAPPSLVGHRDRPARRPGRPRRDRGRRCPSSALVLRLLDPVPSLQPEPLFAVPWAASQRRRSACCW